MRTIIPFVFLTVLLLFSCQDKNDKTPKNTGLELVPPETTYIIETKTPEVLPKIVFAKAYLQPADFKFIKRLPLADYFSLNIIQNKEKLTGFVLIANSFSLDTIFNGKTFDYQNQKIYSEKSGKHNYYATEILGKTFISNQRLFLENCLRNQQNLTQVVQNQAFAKGYELLDKNAQANIIVNLSLLKPDVFYQTKLPFKPAKWGQWEFLDITDTDNPVYSGIIQTVDTTPAFVNIFKDLKPVNIQFDSIIPFSVSENFTFTFDDFKTFYQNSFRFASNHKANSNISPALSGLQAVSFFVENNQNAVVLYMENTDDFTGNEPEVYTSFGDYEIYKNEHPEIINHHFNNILPEVNLTYYTLIDNYILLTENETYLQKILNDIQNNATLSHNPDFQAALAELPGAYHFTWLKNRSKLQRQTCLQVRTFAAENNGVFTNFICHPLQHSKDEILVEQVLSYAIKDNPAIKPQLAWNHHNKQFNIIYQNENNELVLLNLKGKQLWKTKLKGRITGKIKQVDLLRNRKYQYTFVTPHHWYVIDRLGRNVEKFPEYFLQKITRGISVFDYENNRKYRFGITQNKKFRLFDNKARKVTGFKVKTDDEIINPPQHFRISRKDFIVMQDVKGKLYLLNRRGATRIKINQNFNTFRNNWGVYKKKFVNIDDDDNLVAIDINGKIKKDKLDLGSQILSQIKFDNLAAVSQNKMLINNKMIDLDLGTYTRPQIYKLAKKVLIFVADTDNNHIYAYDTKGKLLSNFPIIGQEILDVRADRSGRYILTYDNARNLIVYKF